MGYTVDDKTSFQALDYNRVVKRHHGWAIHDPDSGNCKVTINTGTLGTGADALFVHPGKALLNGSDMSVTESNISIPSPGEKPRKDVIAVDGSGTVVREPGVPERIYPGSTLKISERPAPPDLADTDAVPLAIVLVPGGATSITSDNLVDIRPNAEYTVGTINGDDPTTYPQANSDETITGDWTFSGSVSGINGSDSDGAATLSELTIDADKKWGGYNITNPGTVDGVDISALQTAVSSHSDNTSNPHNVTASQSGALPIDGGDLTGETSINGNQIWHAGNDGPDSGLDADTVDGTHISDLSTRTTTTLQESYTASNFERVLTDASSGSLTVTLPSVSDNLDVTVKKIDSSSNSVTIATPGSEMIDGMSEITITNQYTSRTITASESRNEYFLI